MSLLSAVSRLLKLPAEARRLTLASFFLLFAARLASRLLTGEQVLRLVESVHGSARQAPGDAVRSVREIGAAVRRASRWAPGATCLPQALTAAVLLRRRGLPAQVELGVAMDSRGSLQAHAWTTSDSTVVVGGAQAPMRFQTLR